MSVDAVLAKNKPARNRKKRAAILNRPPVEPSRTYTRREAALALGISVPTIIRAYEAGFLKAFRCGRRVTHSGQQLMDWRETGGQTGCRKQSKIKGGA